LLKCAPLLHHRGARSAEDYCSESSPLYRLAVGEEPLTCGPSSQTLAPSHGSHPQTLLPIRLRSTFYRLKVRRIKPFLHELLKFVTLQVHGNSYTIMS
jgi:hypothetical protein